MGPTATPNTRSHTRSPSSVSDASTVHRHQQESRLRLLRAAVSRPISLGEIFTLLMLNRLTSFVTLSDLRLATTIISVSPPQTIIHSSHSNLDTMGFTPLREVAVLAQSPRRPHFQS